MEPPPLSGMIREPGTLGGKAGKLPAHLPFLRLLLWEATQEPEGLGWIREDKDHVCRQPQVWAGNPWPADSGRPQNWCSCSKRKAFSEPQFPARCQGLPRCVGVGGWWSWSWNSCWKGRVVLHRARWHERGLLQVTCHSWAEHTESQCPRSQIP